jgi:hypothetical protein
MRASPAFQISVTRFGVWRTGVSIMLAATAAVLIAWLFTRDEFTPLGWQIAVGTAGVLLVIAGASLLRIEPLSLRFDGLQWHLGAADPAGDEPSSGKLVVALDLGAWMLLRFDHERGLRHRRIRWLPLQRRGLEVQWHALRCAVYCTRPVSGTDAGMNPAIVNDSKNERP